MRIFYHGLIYSYYRARPGGISNFFDRLISRVALEHDCLLTTTRESHLPHPVGPYLHTVRHNPSHRLRRINKFLESRHFELQSRAFRPDLIHYTYYVDPRPWHLHLPRVYTVYDMIHEKWSHQLDPSRVYAAEKLRSFENASALPCISEATRSDLLDLYPHLEPKTSVIHLGCDLKPTSLAASYPRPADINTSYLLYVGARGSYKNFTRLLLAFARVVPHINGIKLRVVGAPFEVLETDLIDALGIAASVEIFPDANDDMLYQLYSQSLAFVYPSLYEGFGLPLLEAMALNAPVLASSAGSIPEVAGNAALLFNPWSVDSIKESILRIARNPGLRNELITKGRERLLDFTWQKTVDQYLELYDYLLAKPIKG